MPGHRSALPRFLNPDLSLLSQELATALLQMRFPVLDWQFFNARLPAALADRVRSSVVPDRDLGLGLLCLVVGGFRLSMFALR